MNAIYFTPGPSQLYPSYHSHNQHAFELQLGSINHRSNSFRDIYKHTDTQLRALMNIPPTHSIFFASSATEIWEKIILNSVEKFSFHLTNGSFSNRFFEFAQLLKKSPAKFSVPEGDGFNMADIIVPNESELICTTQNETSTGVCIPLDDLVNLKKRYPTKLLCTDLVSIAPYSKIDYNLMDCAFLSVQKAFGMPPGLGVWIVNNEFIHKSIYLQNKGCNLGAHNTIASYVKYYKTFETPSTPNIIAIYILGKIAEDMNRMGIESIRHSIEMKAQMIYNFADNQTYFQPLVKNELHRSPTVVVLNTSMPSIEIIEKIKQENMIIGSGYGSLKSTQIRIANFPATQIDDMKNLLTSLENFV